MRLHYIDRAGWGCRNEACLTQPYQPLLSQLQPQLRFKNEKENLKIIREREIDPDRLSPFIRRQAFAFHHSVQQDEE